MHVMLREQVAGESEEARSSLMAGDGCVCAQNRVTEREVKLQFGFPEMKKATPIRPEGPLWI